MHSSSWRYLVVNSLGTLGYLSIIIQWTWCLITLGNPLLSSDLFVVSAPPAATTNHHPVIDPGPFAPFVPLFAIFVTVPILVLMVFTLVRLPKTVGKKGSEITHVVASQIVKKTDRHHHLTTKKKARLSFWMTWLLKVIAIYIPFALLFVTTAVGSLSTQLITIVGFACAAFSTLYFTLQLLLAITLRLDMKKVW